MVVHALDRRERQRSRLRLLLPLVREWSLQQHSPLEAVVATPVTVVTAERMTSPPVMRRQSAVAPIAASLRPLALRMAPSVQYAGVVSVFKGVPHFAFPARRHRE